MFNLLVTYDATAFRKREVRLQTSRFLESTDSVIRDQLSTLSDDAAAALQTWPTILMEEGRSDERAAICKIEHIAISGNDVLVELEEIDMDDLVLNAHIWQIRDQLGIDSFEFNRCHFAVKSVDALAAFDQADIDIGPLADAFPAPSPLPAPSRDEIVKAKDAMAQWDHARIDDFLFDAGVPGLSGLQTDLAPKKKALAIAKFALDSPGATTADNRLFSRVLVERTGDSGAAGTDRSPAPSNSELSPAKVPPRRIATPPAIAVPSPTESSQAKFRSNRVFVVHGHDEGARTEVASFLSDCGLEPVVLHEQANMGRHLLTKFIDEAAVVGFAVVLLTSDDMGRSASGTLQPRARQNVILELGYFIAHLGPDKVCALKSPGVETPSDFDGVAYVTLDSKKNWMTELRRELVAAELITDMPLSDSA